MPETIRLGRGLGITLKNAEIRKLEEMALAEGHKQVSAWLVGKIRELVLGVQVGRVEPGIGNGAQGDPVTVRISAHETNQSPAEPVQETGLSVSNGQTLERGTVVGVDAHPEGKRGGDPPLSHAAPRSSSLKSPDGGCVEPASNASPEGEPSRQVPLPPTVPVRRSWAGLSLEERRAQAAEWGVKVPEGFAALSRETRLEWFDTNFPLDPFNPVVKEEEPEW